MKLFCTFDNSAYQDTVRFILQKVEDEALIDLDTTEWQVTQQTQRRISGAEVVRGDAQPLALEEHQILLQSRDICGSGMLCQLQRQIFMWEIRLMQDVEQIVAEPRMIELMVGDIDTDDEVRIDLQIWFDLIECRAQDPEP